MAAEIVSGIYEIVNLVNGKRYIGSAVNIENRWRVHRHGLRAGTHHSRHLQAAWLKYGEHSFEFRLLSQCDRDALTVEEQAAMDRYSPEYNISPVAGRPQMSEAGRQRLRARMLGNTNTLGLQHTEEAKARIAERAKGNTRTKGKPRNRDAVEATAFAHRGMKRSDETRAKISAAKKGKAQSPRGEEWRRRLSEAQKGKPKSPEQMAALQAGRAKRIYTDEQRAAIAAASKAAWLRRKAALLPA